MGGLGSFLNAFGATTMHYQDQAQEMQKFQLGLQMQQAQLAMQQMQFERTMQNRDLLRQDALKQHEMENMFAQQNAAREERNTASLIESRQGETARKEATAASAALTAEAGATPSMEEYRFKADDARKHGDEKLAREYEAKMAGMEDLANKAARRPPGAGPQAQPSAGPLPGNASPAENAGQDLGEGGSFMTAQPQGGGAPTGGGGMGTQGSIQRSPGGQTMRVISGDVGAQSQQNQMQARAAAPGGQTKVQPLSSGLQEENYATEAEAEAVREKYKKYHVMGRLVTSDESKAEAKAKLTKAQVDDRVNQGALLSSDDGKREVQDILNNSGLQDVEFQADPKGMVRSGYNVNLGAGGLLKSTLRGSYSTTGGESHTELPKAAFVPRGRPRWTDNVPGMAEYVKKSEATVAPEFAENVATALANDALQKGKPLDPLLSGAAKDLVRTNKLLIEDLAPGEKTIILKPFDAFNRPERAAAANLAKSGKRAEDQLAGVTEKYTRVGLPSVVDDNQIPLNQKLGLFTSAVTGNARAYQQYGVQNERVAKPLDVEQQGLALQELAQHLQPDLKDGSFSPAAKAEAMKAWEAVQQSNWDPQSKQGAYQILKPVISSPTTPEGEKAAKKEQAAAEKPAEAAGGTGGVRGMLTLAALGGMGSGGAGSKSQEKAKPAPKAPPTPPKGGDATAVSIELSSVKAAQDRPAAAKKAADNISSTWGRLSETERATVRKQWQTQRGTWKSYGVSEDILAKLDKLIGKDKSRADTISDAAREIDALTKKKKG